MQNFAPTPGWRLSRPAWRRTLGRAVVVASITGASTTLAGCSLFQREAPEPKTVVSGVVPAAWSAPATADTVADDWLKDFNDPTLTSLVEEAWRNNATLLSAISRRDASAARAAIDKAANLPRLDFQASVGRQRQINDFLGNSTVLPSDAYISRIRFGLGLSWELDVWNRVLDLNHAAAGDLVSVMLDVEAARFSLAAQTASLWFSLVAADQRLELSQALQKSQNETVRISGEREASGLLSTAELIKLETDQAAADGDLVARKLERDRIARSLEVLVGRYPAAALEASGALPPMPAPIAAGLPSNLLERRPDIQAAALRVTASDDRLLAAKKNLLPRFTLNASGGTQSKYRDLLFDDDSFTWSLGGGLLQPIFDGGQIRAGIRVQRALMVESVQKYRDKALSAFREVEDGLATEAALRQQRDFVQRALDLSMKNQSLTQKSYDNGTLDAGTNLGAERGVVLARIKALDLDLALLNNRIALDLALGGSPVVRADGSPAAADAATPVLLKAPLPEETAPVGAPTAPAVETPVAAPVEMPAAAPVEAPAAVPAETPAAAPVEAPAAVPVEAPAAAPVSISEPATTSEDQELDAILAAVGASADEAVAPADTKTGADTVPPPAEVAAAPTP
ncbi:MAG: Efflux transporter, outer rane factor lipoprotein NodT family [Hydrocarboniphaga sp.]|uniref:efflux transporter outer membrane subunit n=1 Tax=Hydrocarboniphaga sp. TaxID=2033016 RepID=UPI00260560DA|nr:TolC family protein [Hydrocarboniphaga sp.]MDB5969294.1 Efflux transporter, outer rane factor lipoprotein NodT family [Hydrocarboniphaga sp.]